MGYFASTFKFGVPGNELSLTGALQPFTDEITFNFGRLEAVNESVIGETFVRILRRTEIKMNLKITGASSDQLAAIRSLQMIPHTHLSLIYAGPQKIFSERYALKTATTLRMVSNSHLRLDKAYYQLTPPGAAQVSILGVYAAYDPLGAQATGNRFVSFDRSTWDITITPGGTPGDIFHVNWTYTGALVKIDSLSAKQYGFENGDVTHEINISLRGV